MTRIEGPSPLPLVPAPKAAAAPGVVAPASPVQAAVDPVLAPAQLGALDTMMQAFLADGQLSAAELQAYQAARAAFVQGGWDGVPLPDDDGPVAPA
ncbi:MAG: hypothetical protein JWM80_3761, partial [Cyanobacteria bacterium RYN_339]|nr:hypothetical protein [Cyanobacteria bacterium RYN_339]